MLIRMPPPRTSAAGGRRCGRSTRRSEAPVNREPERSRWSQRLGCWRQDSFFSRPTPIVMIGGLGGVSVGMSSSGRKSDRSVQTQSPGHQAPIVATNHLFPGRAAAVPLSPQRPASDHDLPPALDSDGLAKPQAPASRLHPSQSDRPGRVFACRSNKAILINSTAPHAPACPGQTRFYGARLIFWLNAFRQKAAV